MYLKGDLFLNRENENIYPYFISTCSFRYQWEKKDYIFILSRKQYEKTDKIYDSNIFTSFNDILKSVFYIKYKNIIID